MRTLLAIGLALLVVAPGVATAKRAPEAYPDFFVKLLPGFIAASEARGNASASQPWYPDAARFLQHAKDSAAAGRFRIALFDLETYEELVVANRLNDSTMSLGSEGERKSRVVSDTQKALDDSEARWTAFREKLHGYDGQVKSLHTAEAAVFAADMALTAMTASSGFGSLARDFPKQPGFDFGYVDALVRASYVPGLDVAWADAMLDAAAAQEGTPPRLLSGNFTNLTAEALLLDYTGVAGISPGVTQLEARLKPVRAHHEGILALAGAFAEQRADRLSQMQTQFGDAKARRDVVHDADRFMDKSLNNTTLATPGSHGLMGIYTADAVDRALFTHELVASDKAELGAVLVAWSAIDNAHYAEDVLAKVSPVESTATKPTPAPAWIGLLSIALVAAALGRKAARPR